MRLNIFLAQHTRLSRRAADKAIEQGKVDVNGLKPALGQLITLTDTVQFEGRIIKPESKKITTIMLNKPVGYVCSRNGQGSKTIYDLIPNELQYLKAVGRLDKDSSGLILLTNNGQLAHELTHPSYQKTKVYEITLDKTLAPLHQQIISDKGINLEDGPSKLVLENIDNSRVHWQVTMREGRNRQIRRTFAALGYKVVALHRISFGSYELQPRNLDSEFKDGDYRIIEEPYDL